MSNLQNPPENSIQFLIFKIETLQFAILSEEVNEKSLAIKSDVTFSVDEDSRLIRVIFKYEFQSDEKPALILEALIDFQISDECFIKQIQTKEGFSLPKSFATHLAMIVVSTARGILHEKTKASALNNFPLALINVTEIIPEDILIARAQ